MGVCCQTRQRCTADRSLSDGFPYNCTRGDDLGQGSQGNIEELKQLFAPGQPMNVEEERPRRVAGVRDVQRPARQVPSQPAVDGPGTDLSRERGATQSAVAVQ